LRNYENIESDRFLFFWEDNLIMDWKEFLKPTKEKIVVSIIVGLLLYFAAPYTIQKNILGFIYIPILILPILLLGITCGGDFCVGGLLEYGLLVIVGIIYTYLISCFIVWIYDKVKKR